MHSIVTRIAALAVSGIVSASMIAPASAATRHKRAAPVQTESSADVVGCRRIRRGLRFPAPFIRCRTAVSPTRAMAATHRARRAAPDRADQGFRTAQRRRRVSRRPAALLVVVFAGNNPVARRQHINMNLNEPWMRPLSAAIWPYNSTKQNIAKPPTAPQRKSCGAGATAAEGATGLSVSSA